MYEPSNESVRAINVISFVVIVMKAQVSQDSGVHNIRPTESCYVEITRWDIVVVQMLCVVHENETDGDCVSFRGRDSSMSRLSNENRRKLHNLDAAADKDDKAWAMCVCVCTEHIDNIQAHSDWMTYSSAGTQLRASLFLYFIMLI